VFTGEIAEKADTLRRVPGGQTEDRCLIAVEDLGRETLVCARAPTLARDPACRGWEVCVMTLVAMKRPARTQAVVTATVRRVLLTEDEEEEEPSGRYSALGARNMAIFVGDA